MDRYDNRNRKDKPEIEPKLVSVSFPGKKNKSKYDNSRSSPTGNPNQETTAYNNSIPNRILTYKFYSSS